MLGIIGRFIRWIFGTRNDRVVKRLRLVADKASTLEDRYRALSDADLKDTTRLLRERLAGGQTVADILPDAFAACREAGRRVNKMRHFDSQFIGGQVLFEGSIAEMATGEGKTLVATLPCYLGALTGRRVHVWSVNDYLVKRDRDWMAPVYEALGLSSGAIQSTMGSWGDGALERQRQYATDICYGTNNELGFDYLRDNMKMAVADQVQRRRDFAIVDEADSILIDEARTPLIIAGPAADDTTRFAKADEVVRRLIQVHKPYADAQKRLDAAKRSFAKAEADAAEAARRGDKKAEEKAKAAREDAVKSEAEAQADVDNRVQFYEVELDRHSVRLTHDGIAEAQKAAGVGSFFVGANAEWPHLLEQCLKAHLVYERDKNYVVQDGEVKIVDEFTGRILEGRQWSDGLHQAVEAKERVRIKEETQTLATITIQNFARLYGKVAGMTGTAMTEAEELMKIYGVDVVNVPTNRPVNRIDHEDLIYQNIPDKADAIVEEVHGHSRRGRPDTGIHFNNALAALIKAYERVTSRPGAPAGTASLLSRARELHTTINSADSVDQTFIEKCGTLFDEVFGETLAHGRPVLVGTTSIEKSEKLSVSLTKRYGIEHQVLNAKPENARRESEIVAEAGQIRPVPKGPNAGKLWGTVTIATNMAGRGTDIKLGAGVVYDKCKGDLGGYSAHTVDADGKPVADAKPPAEAASAKRAWHESGITGTKCCIRCPDYDEATNCAHCFKPKLDPRFPALGRELCPVSPPCGLHIVGTERHESRRIDNQLRGRSGRQGDPGSSLFFLSLEDELLRIFMPEWTLRALRWLGLKDGEAIQDRRVSKGIERAQKKVEERHFNSRKHLLEYDEVNNQQRKIFYGRRQQILEGRGIRAIIREMVDETLADAVEEHFSPLFRGKALAEWAKLTHLVPVEPSYAKAEMDLDEVEHLVRSAAKDRVHDDDVMRGALEHMDEEEEDRKAWDLGGLAGWAQKMFGVVLPPKSKLQSMSRDEIIAALQEAAVERAAEIDCKPAMKFFERAYPAECFAKWAEEKFGIALKAGEIVDLEPGRISAKVRAAIEEAWHRREAEEPLRWALGHYEQLGIDTHEAAGFLSAWVKDRYKTDLPPDKFRTRAGRDILKDLVPVATEWLGAGKLERYVDEQLGRAGVPVRELRDPAATDGVIEVTGGNGAAPSDTVSEPEFRGLAEWAKKEFKQVPFLEPVRLAEHRAAAAEADAKLLAAGGFPAPQDPLPILIPSKLPDAARLRAELLRIGREHLRQELSRLEQRLLLDTYDRAWKDHLYNLDFLKETVGLSSYGERDPKNVYKKDGFEMFKTMLAGIRDRVTSRIFRVEVSDDEEARSIYHVSATIHEQFAGFEQQQKQAIEASAEGASKVVAPVVKEGPKVGRNDPCPCGSGKKFKKCHGKGA